MFIFDWYPQRIILSTHRLKVSALHEIYVEECGNPNGKPVIWLHGGPGSGIAENHGRQFDPSFYRIILFDQRGAGGSTPYAEIKENTTQELIGDIKKIRQYFKIDKWIVAGRSWGTTLALAYAEAHPQHISALYLPAVFLGDKKSIDWLFQEGAGNIFAEAWEKFKSLITPQKQNNLVKAYHELMFGPDQDMAIKAASYWGEWEANTVSLVPDEKVFEFCASERVMLALGRMECHYMANNCFLEEDQILRDAHKIAHIPTMIIHGRHDMNCLFDNAYRLHKALPKSTLFAVETGAHEANDGATIDAQIRAAEELKSI